MHRADRLVRPRLGLVQSHAFLSDTALTERLDGPSKSRTIFNAVCSAAFESTQVLVVGKSQGY